MSSTAWSRGSLTSAQLEPIIRQPSIVSVGKHSASKVAKILKALALKISQPHGHAKQHLSKEVSAGMIPSRSRSILQLEVDDDVGDGVMIVGRVEVEKVRGREVIITLLPSEEDVFDSEGLFGAREPLPEEAVEIADVFDVFTQSLFGCVGECHEIFPKKEDKSVHFGPIQIDEYRMTLGDHPSASSGPPMALDWDRCVRSRQVSLDEYERARSPRRKRKQLKIPYKTRRILLEKDAGFSTSQINTAWAEALLIRKQRQETRERGLILQYVDDFSESATRKFRRFSEGMGRLVGIGAV